MRPPICAICDNRFFKGGGLIYFKENEDDLVYNERLKQPGFVGHPSNAFWFCEKHIINAKKYSDLTKTEAFGILKNLEEKSNNNFKNKKNN